MDPKGLLSGAPKLSPTTGTAVDDHLESVVAQREMRTFEGDDLGWLFGEIPLPVGHYMELLQ